MNYDRCPNCNKSLKGFFSGELIAQARTDFINKHLDQSKEGYCTSCSDAFINKIATTFAKQKLEIEQRLQKIIDYIPVITSPAPIKWDYEVIGMVSAQTTSGEGFSTELSQSFNEFFGTSSNATNRKIAGATTLCKANLRVQCVKSGGNAVISTDIDFNEIGAAGKMLMVCMAGTAIRVTDMTNFNEKIRERVTEIFELTEQLEAIAAMNK